MKISIIFFFLVITLHRGCQDESAEPSGLNRPTYTPLHVGDVQQLINLADSSTILLKISGTVKRGDGIEVFVQKRYYGNKKPDTMYYFIKDGYYSSTMLYKIFNTDNPYGEQRLCKANPVDGETWLCAPHNDTASFMVAKYYGEKSVLCGTFTNVYCFSRVDLSSGIADTIGSGLFAENIGFIGTKRNNHFNQDLSVSYARVGDQEYGALWPMKPIAQEKK